MLVPKAGCFPPASIPSIARPVDVAPLVGPTRRYHRTTTVPWLPEVRLLKDFEAQTQKTTIRTNADHYFLLIEVMLLKSSQNQRVQFKFQPLN
jgi:hypothetical protein